MKHLNINGFARLFSSQKLEGFVKPLFLQSILLIVAFVAGVCLPRQATAENSHSIEILGSAAIPKVTITQGVVTSVGGGIATTNNGYIIINGLRMKAIVNYFGYGISDALIRSVSNWSNPQFDRGLRVSEPDVYRHSALFTVDDVALFKKQELEAECDSQPQGGVFVVRSGVRLMLRGFWGYGEFVGPGYWEDDVYDEIEITVTCNSTADKLSQVERPVYSYECPETQKTNMDYWSKYRFVVSGTGFRGVSTNDANWKPICSLAYLGNSENMDKVVNGWD